MSENVHTVVKSSAEARGRRLKSLRKMADFSRKALTIKYQISASTIQAWEDGKAGGLTSKGAQRIIAALREEGVFCTVDWLMHGIGQAPHLAERVYLRSMELSHEYNTQNDLSSADSITRELLLFRQLHTDVVDLIINDDGMGSFYQIGDTIAGVRARNSDIEKLLGKDCIIELQNGEVLFRRLRKGDTATTYHLQCLNLEATIKEPFRYNQTLLAAAAVIWHRRVN